MAEDQIHRGRRMRTGQRMALIDTEIQHNNDNQSNDIKRRVKGNTS